MIPGRRPGFRSPHDPSEKDVPRRVVYSTTTITKVTPAKSKWHQDALIEVTQTTQNPFRMYVAQLEKNRREDPITFLVSTMGAKS